MSRMAMRARNAFSLLEIIIATAILAGSAMVLFSLIGLGTKYGNRAEEQTSALTQAQSVLDEVIANLSDEEIQEGVSGVLNGVPARSYRIEILPFELAGNSGAGRNSSTSSEMQTVLVRVTVALFKGNVSLAGMESEPLCQLTRLVRKPRLDGPAGEPSSNVGGGL
jgi:type II secretory pathway pseudopilin PulG